MPTKKIRVNVTSEHIAKSRKDAWRRNPVAIALRAAGFRYVRVSSFWLDLAEVSNTARNINSPNVMNEAFDLPKKVKRFLEKYVAASSRKEINKLRPVSFVVKVTPEIENALRPFTFDPADPAAVYITN